MHVWTKRQIFKSKFSRKAVRSFVLFTVRDAIQFAYADGKEIRELQLEKVLTQKRLIRGRLVARKMDAFNNLSAFVVGATLPSI